MRSIMGAKPSARGFEGQIGSGPAETEPRRGMGNERLELFNRHVELVKTLEQKSGQRT